MYYIIAFVCGDICCSIFAGSMLYVFSSISAKTGVAPTNVIADAVAVKVYGGNITSSPRPILSALKITSRLTVPLGVATAYFASQ